MRLNREEFLSSLEMLQPGLSPSFKETTDQSSCFGFDTGWVMTFNGEIACWSKTKLKITGAVQAKPLLQLLHKMTEEEIDISLLQEEVLLIVGQRKSARLAVQVNLTMPLEAVERPETWTALPEDFSEAIGIVEFCAGKDKEGELILTMINIHPKWVEACDGARATRYRLPTGVTEPCQARRDSLKHIVPMGMAEIAVADHWIHFRNPSKTMLSCRRWVEDYPSIKDILKVEGTPIVFPKGLADASERAGIFSGENAADDQVLIEVKKDKLRVKGQGSSGSYSESKKMKYAGPPISFTVSPKMLSEIVKQHTNCEIAKERLKVDGGKFTFVTCLGVGDEEIAVEH